MKTKLLLSLITALFLITGLTNCSEPCEDADTYHDLKKALRQAEAEVKIREAEYAAAPPDNNIFEETMLREALFNKASIERDIEDLKQESDCI